MESLENANVFLNKVFQVFTPTSVKLEVTRTTSSGKEIKEYKSYVTSEQHGKTTLFRYLWTRSNNRIKVNKVEFTAVPGTIRVHDSSYPRVPRARVSFMGLDIEILNCNPDTEELQQICISNNRLERKGSIKLDLTKLKEKWNENPRHFRMAMPMPVSNIVHKLSKKRSVQNKSRLRRGRSLDSTNSRPQTILTL